MTNSISRLAAEIAGLRTQIRALSTTPQLGHSSVRVRGESYPLNFLATETIDLRHDATTLAADLDAAAVRLAEAEANLALIPDQIAQAMDDVEAAVLLTSQEQADLAAAAAIAAEMDGINSTIANAQIAAIADAVAQAEILANDAGAAAQAAAIAAAAADATAKANQAKSDALTAAATDAQTKAAAAQAAATAAAAADATSKANAAQAAALAAAATDAQTKANAAQAAAEAAAELTAQGLADAAEAAALAAAATDAQTKATAAQAAATAAASADATSKANAAQAAALAAAAIDAQAKADATLVLAQAAADAAKAAAIAAAAADATAKANAARQAAIDAAALTSADLADLAEAAAIAAASTDATTKANAAKAAAIAAAATDATAKADQAEADALTAAAITAQTKADAAKAAAIAAAATTAQTKADTAKAEALAAAAITAQQKADAAQAAATAAGQTAANSAQAAAIAAAAADATTKANTAKSEAISAAAADALTKANAAQAAAISAAALTAQQKADLAEAEAIAAAATTAQQKADAAQSAAIAAARAMEIGGGNLVPNSAFRDGLTGWGKRNATHADKVTVITSDPYMGVTESLRMEVPNPFATQGFSQTTRIDIAPGKNVTASIYARRVSGSGQPTLGIEFLGPSGYVGGEYKPITINADGTYERTVLSKPVKAGATQAFLMVYEGGATAGSVFHFKMAQAEIGEIATAYAPKTDEILPGTITEPMILANAVTTAKLAANSVVASKIATDAIEADKIKAGAVVAAKIAAGSVTASKLFISDATNIATINDNPASQSYAGQSYGYVTVGTETNWIGRVTGTPTEYFMFKPDNTGPLPFREGDRIRVTFEARLASGSSGINAMSWTYGPNGTQMVGLPVVAGSPGTLTTTPTTFTLEGTVGAGHAGQTSFVVGLLSANFKTMEPRVRNVRIHRMGAGELIVDGTVIASKIATDAVEATKIKAGAVVAGKLAADAVVANNIKAGEIGTGHLAALAVTANKIAANTITAAQIAADTITAAQIGANAITASELAADSVIAAKIQAGAVIAGKLAADSVVASNIKALEIGTTHLVANAVTAEKIVAAAIQATHIAADAISATHISAGAIGTDELAANAVTANKIIGGAIIAGKLAADAVLAANIKAGEIGVGHLAANSINTAALIADAVTAAKIASTAIETRHLTALAVTADKIAANSISADKIQANAITAAKLAAEIVLSTVLIAGDPAGTHTRIAPDGLRTFTPSPDGGIQEAVRLGVSGEADSFALSSAAGQVVARIDPDGRGQFSAVNIPSLIRAPDGGVEKGLEIYGKEFLEHLDSLPRGLVAHGSRTTAGALTATTEVPYLEVAAQLKKGRAYRIYTSNLHVLQKYDTGRTVVNLRATSNGTAPTTTSTRFAHGRITATANVDQFLPVTLTYVLQSTSDHTRRILLSYLAESGEGYIAANWDSMASLVVEDIGPSLGDVGVLRSAAPPATNPKQTYTTGWAATASRNFNSNHAEKSPIDYDMIHGPVPGATSNNRYSIALFTGTAWEGEVGLTIGQALSGATIKKVEVLLTANHWYSGSGGTAYIRPYNGNTLPTTGPGASWGGLVTSGSWPNPGSRWVDITAVATSSIGGIVLGSTGTTSLATYGRFVGASQGGARPHLRITYEK